MSVGEVGVDCDRDVWVLSLHGEHDLTTTPSLRSKLERAALAYGRDQAVEHEEHVLAVVVPSSGVALRLLTLTGLDGETGPLRGA